MYTILHAVVGYFFLLFVVRVLSRRPGAQLTPFEFVIVFLIGGLIILSTVGAIITIGLMHRLTAAWRGRSARLAKAIDGVPLVLLAKGRWQTEAMRHMRLQDQDVMATARAKGIRELAGVRYAILERVGTISIIPATEGGAARDEADGKADDGEAQRDGRSSR